MNTIRKAALLQKRRWRIRKKVQGTAARPRLSVRFTTKHIYAQAIDDDAKRADALVLPRSSLVIYWANALTTRMVHAMQRFESLTRNMCVDRCCGNICMPKQHLDGT